MRSVAQPAMSKPKGARTRSAGSHDRLLHTKNGEITLKAPKLRRQTFEARWRGYNDRAALLVSTPAP
jgi:transposase-like protein